MKTELEEAAENYNDDFQIKGGSKPPHIKNVHIMNHFIAGAKWQQEKSYSEEDMLGFAWFLLKNVGQYSDDRIAHFEGKYLEQFKKK